MNNFQVEIIPLLERKKGNHNAFLPIISKKLSITNFFEAYDTFADDYIGQNNCTINWVLRDDIVVGPATTLASDQPYSATHVSIEDEMIQRFTHSNPFYKADNATVYAQIVIFTLGSQYTSTIATFQIEKNCCGAINALKAYIYVSAN